MEQTVVVYIVKILESAGAECIQGVIDDSLNGLSDSLSRMGIIEQMSTCHEEMAALTAGTEA